MLKSLSVRYDPVEDRLVVELSVQEGEAPSSYTLHITRRVCAAWRRDLQTMVDLSAQAPARLDPVAKAVVSKAHHDAMSSQAKVTTEPRRTEPSTSKASEPLLVTKILGGRRKTDNRWVLRFETQSLPPISLVLSSQTLHALVDALARRIRTAAWGLEALPNEALPLQSPSPAGQFH